VENNMDSFFAASLGLSNPYKSRYTSATRLLEGWINYISLKKLRRLSGIANLPWVSRGFMVETMVAN
jgi:hypothetical protein